MRAAKLIGLVVLLSAASVRAEDAKEQAKRDVGAGLAAQSAGHYDEAIAHYKRAYEAVPHPEILFNLGQAYRLKGDAETALGYYRRYLAAEPNGRAAKDAKRWIDELGKRVAAKGDAARSAAGGDSARKVATAGGDSARTTGAGGSDSARKGDATRPAAGDSARKSATAGGDSARKAATAAGGDSARKAATAAGGDPARKADAARGGDRKPPAAASAARTPASSRETEVVRPPDSAGNVEPSPQATEASGSSGATAPLPPPPSEPPPRYRLVRWVLVGTGGTALLGSFVFGALAQSKLDAATAICGADHRCDTAGDTGRANALLAQSRTRGTVSTALVVLGAAGMATGALWWLGRRGEATQTSIAPIVSPETVGVALGGAF